MTNLMLTTINESTFHAYAIFAYIVLSVITFYSIRLIIRRIEKQKRLKICREKEKAEKESLLKSKFIANIDHEIRIPLNAITGFSDLICDAQSPKEKQEFAKIISANSQLLLQIIDDVLDMTKIEAGTIDLSYSDVDINKLLSDIQKQFIKLNNNPKVKIYFTNKFPKMVLFTDKYRIKQVMSNFLNNALKFTKEGEITFGYRLYRRQPYFFVKDTGIGIPENKIEDVFKRFIRLNRQTRGIGLGLPICRVIIERLKGSIGVHSEENVGSEFWFRLPASTIIAIEKKEKKKWPDLRIQKIPLQQA